MSGVAQETLKAPRKISDLKAPSFGDTWLDEGGGSAEWVARAR
jgi:hypothetical protein